MPSTAKFCRLFLPAEKTILFSLCTSLISSARLISGILTQPHRVIYFNETWVGRSEGASDDGLLVTQ